MFFLSMSELSHGILVLADTWQLSYASKNADSPLIQAAATQAVVIPDFPHAILSDSFCCLQVLTA